MSSFVLPVAGVPRRPDAAFWAWHALLLPLACVLLAQWLRHSGWDERLSAAWFDPATQRFTARGWPWLELLGHRVAKSLLLALWGLGVVAALVAPWVPALARHRRLLWTTVLAMGLGPALVALLKDINTHPCPWDMKGFGGSAEYSARWFVSRAEAGRCFPSGHAAGGFSLVALVFAARSLGQPRLERWALLATCGVGLIFSLVRTAQGAHFVSHSLWSAAIDWWVALLVFATLWLRPAAPAAGSSTASTN
jgi:membrane-associated PAP2 superfamily phosphatase